MHHLEEHSLSIGSYPKTTQLLEPLVTFCKTLSQQLEALDGQNDAAQNETIYLKLKSCDEQTENEKQLKWVLL